MIWVFQRVSITRGALISMLYISLVHVVGEQEMVEDRHFQHRSLNDALLFSLRVLHQGSQLCTIAENRSVNQCFLPVIVAEHVDRSANAKGQVDGRANQGQAEVVAYARV